MGLELSGNETAHHGDSVYVGRNRVGVITSGTRSPVLQKNIALCRMAVQYREPGNRQWKLASWTVCKSGSRGGGAVSVLRPGEAAPTGLSISRQ